MQAIFDEVRKRCSPAVWSRGVELTRTDAVTGVRADDDEIVVRISTKGGLICPTVTLFPSDGDWECSCGAQACEHAAAAVISLRRAREAGKELPGPSFETGHVGYRLSRAGGALALERVLVHGGTERSLELTLAAVVRGRASGPPFAATPEDLSIELALGTHRRGPVTRSLWPKLLGLLARCEDVLLDRQTVRVARDLVVPIARVEDHGDGFRLSVRNDDTVTEQFQNGVALCGDLLRPVGDTRLTGRELHELPHGKHFGYDQVAELVTEVLPSLRSRIAVEIATSRLPGSTVEAPRIAIDTQREGVTLSVLPTLVYGDPPKARVDAGRLVPLLDGPIPVRDTKGEQRLVRQLQAELGLTPGARVTLAGEEAVAFAGRLRGWEGELLGKALEAFRVVAPIVPRVQIDEEIFDVYFESPARPGASRGSGGRADAGAVMRAWREGASLVPLLEGGWAPLPADWLARHGHLVADLLAARDDERRLARCALPDLARLCDDLEIPTTVDLGEMRKLARGFESVPSATLPSDLTATLRPYQREGVNRLVFLRKAGLGAMLADDMGLGKTLQALCAIEGRTLVVCPTSVLHNWVDEIHRFRPELRHAVFHGPRRRLDPTADVTLTTYAILRSDEDLLAAEAWDTAVLDEAQNIKNPQSQVTRAAWRLKPKFPMTLTGTPVENRLEELWSQFHFINRGLLGARQDFDERYARPIAEGEPGAADRLRKRIGPFVVRRLKRDVAPELPPRSEAVLYCSMEPTERAVYDAVHAATRPAVVQKLQEGGSVLAVLEALLRLRQAACHPALIPGQSAQTSAKVARLLEVLETVIADGHKALVFSQWTSLLDLIEPHLSGATIGYVRLDGSTRDRGEVVGKFQDPAGPPVMLVSLKAGGTGLNLTAADHVFLMDPWWNPAVEDQAADRAHRIGQERPVIVYRLVAEETIEERILALQESKRALADAALGAAERGGTLTRDDLMFLLG